MPQPSPAATTAPPSPLRRPLQLFLLLLLPVGYFAMRYDRYAIDGDAVAYMDIADLLHAHHWAGAVNGYWHPLYPAFLWLGQALFHTTRTTELTAYYWINLLIFFLQVAAMLAFTTALYRLRTSLSSFAAPGSPARVLGTPGWPSGGSAAPATTPAGQSLLSLNALRLLGLALLVISVQRELSLGRVRPDALLQALILAALAALLNSLAIETVAASLGFAALMGLLFGLAYLAKSFAFVLALLSIATLVLFAAFIQRQRLTRAIASGALAFAVFLCVAGPYMAALSHQKHRFDFGDSGSLNYAWYVGGTEKMHLEPWMTHDFGSATVHLIHPEQQLAANPGVYSYKALALGTYPPWFDTTFFNERIVPHMTLRGLASRDSRNFVLVFRYIFNHPEALILLGVLLFLGARLRPGLRSRFWWPAVALGLAMWVIYGMVNVEERYVTVAYLVVLIPIFAALQAPSDIMNTLSSRPESPHVGDAAERPASAAASTVVIENGSGAPGPDSRTRVSTPLSGSSLRITAQTLILLLAFLALGETLRESFATRRDESVSGYTHGWDNPQIFGAAAGLNALGVHPGDEIACIGTTACLFDNYWARIAGVRVLTEIYEPDPHHLIDQLGALPNLRETYDVVQQQGARVLVGYFDPGEMNAAHPASRGWQRLGETNFYALPLNLPGADAALAKTQPRAQ